MSLSFLTDLGAPEVLLSSAPGQRPRVNSHLHLPPNFSAFKSVAQLIALAEEQEIGVLGASNYYDYTVYEEFAKRATERGVFPIFGLEIISLDAALQQSGVKINDPGNPGRFYLCGKGITGFSPLSTEAAALLDVIRTSDTERMATMATLLSDALAIPLSASAIRTTLAERYGCAPETVFLQERHLAQAFQEALFAAWTDEARATNLERLFGAPAKAPDDAASVQNELRSYLMKAGKPAYAPERFVDFDHAYRLVLALGGVPVYPSLLDGASPLCAFEATPDALIAALTERRIYAAELIPIRNAPEVLTQYVTALRAAGLIVTAGTEHNTPELLPLNPTCKGGVPIPEVLEEIFWEGACVLAAHQYLVARGELGYVDHLGVLNPNYASVEARIAAFRTLGAAVIAHARARR